MRNSGCGPWSRGNEKARGVAARANPLAPSVPPRALVTEIVAPIRDASRGGLLPCQRAAAPPAMRTRTAQAPSSESGERLLLTERLRRRHLQQSWAKRSAEFSIDALQVG